MSGLSSEERETARRAAEVARRAARRLDILEWLMLAAATFLAVLGGGVVASLVAGPLGLDVRTAWIGASLLLLVIPGGIVLLNMTKDERAATRDDDRDGAPDDG